MQPPRNLRVDGGERMQPPDHIAIRSPKTCKHSHEVVQRSGWIITGAKNFGEATHLTPFGKIVVKRLQKSSLGIELVVNSQPGDIGLAGYGVHGEPGKALRSKPLVRAGEHALTRGIGRGLTLRHLVGPRAHSNPPFYLIIQSV